VKRQYQRAVAIGLTAAIVIGLGTVAWTRAARADGVEPSLPPVAERYQRPPTEAREYRPEQQYYREAPPVCCEAPPVYREPQRYEPCCVRYLPPPPPPVYREPCCVRYYQPEGQYRPHVRDFEAWTRGYWPQPPVEYRWR
jgi:hypothetical protein